MGRIQRGVPESFVGKRLVPSAEPAINQLVVAEGGQLKKPHGAELYHDHWTNPTATLDEIKGVVNAVTMLGNRPSFINSTLLDRLTLDINNLLQVTTKIPTPHLRWVIGISTRFFAKVSGTNWGRFIRPTVQAFLQTPSRVDAPLSIMTNWSEFVHMEDPDDLLQATTVALTVDMLTQPLNSEVKINIHFPTWTYIQDQLDVEADYAINATYSLRPVVIAAWKPDE